MAQPSTVFVGSNGINMGCGSIAMALEDLLVGHGYRVVHFSSGNSLTLLQENGRTCQPIDGYVEKTNSYFISEMSVVVDYVYKNLKLALNPSMYNVISEQYKQHQPIAYVSVWETQGMFVANDLGLPVIEFSDMLFFKLNLDTCLKVQVDHETSYRTGLHISGSDYAKGLAITLFPSDVDACDVPVPSNVKLVAPILSAYVKSLSPLPVSLRDHVVVYVSGASAKCEWLYATLARMPEFQFKIFVPPDEAMLCEQLQDAANLHFYRANYKHFVDAMQGAICAITNSGMQTAAEALYLRVRNFALPTANHHAQKAVGESIANNGLGQVCLRGVKAESHKCTDMEGRLRAYLTQCKHLCASGNDAAYYPQVPASHLDTEQTLLDTLRNLPPSVPCRWQRTYAFRQSITWLVLLSLLALVIALAVALYRRLADSH
jgi:hypothetical protein